MKIVTIIGARPQLIKSAMISRAIKTSTAPIEELILHTGQHYDTNMNEVFFHNLGIRQPDWQLHCGGLANQAETLAAMLTGIEKALIESRPDYTMVFGDTTSTLAGALAASMLHIPVIHIEAGLRSFNPLMPEERNRVLTDHIASLLFCPTYKAIENLAREGITRGLFHAGDVMYDAALVYGAVAEEGSKILSELGIESKRFRLCTIHRAENTDNPDCLKQIIAALVEIATSDCPVILPLHPRTRSYIDSYNLAPDIALNPHLRLISPVDYLDMVMLEKNALMILTDSGGVQKEAYFHRTPCITLRDETEWVETVEAGWNIIAGRKTGQIIAAVNCCRANHRETIPEYGHGEAAEKIINAIIKYHEINSNPL